MFKINYLNKLFMNIVKSLIQKNKIDIDQLKKRKGIKGYLILRSNFK